ncbi:hypothetical protein MRX96_017030 [Rhipicephalus microplus]
MILINFVEDTTRVKEHLDGLVADYTAKHENNAPDDTGMAFSPKGGACRPRSANSGAVNVLEKHPGSSPTRSSAPVLLPSDVSTQDMLLMTSDEARTAEGRLPKFAGGQGATAGSKSLIPVEIDQALKEEYSDREIMPCFVEENVELLLESENEEYNEELSAAASPQYPENSTSWNKIKDACDASTTVVAGTERCGSDTTGAASRAFIYDCPLWAYDQGGDEVAAAIAEIASNAAATTLHPWSSTLRAAAAAAETGVHEVTATGPGAVAELPSSEATAGGNSWGPFLATSLAIVGPKMGGGYVLWRP